MGTKNNTITCSTCSYCEGLRPSKNTRTNYFCMHPEQSYISAYFAQHRIKKMHGFLGFGEALSDTVPLKTAPAWCPRKKSQNTVN